VLLHPLALSSEVWGTYGALLARSFDVIAPDARGHGKSGWDSEPFGIDDLADDVAALYADYEQQKHRRRLVDFDDLIALAVKLLATDAERHRVSMLVRLAPGASYPAHTHADVEELHLLDGELWIDERKLVPGDYNYGAPGASDEHVWSETGCTCLLVTSTKDILR